MLQSWQAIGIAYGVLLLASETELGPVAVVMAWSIALVDLINTLQNGQGVWEGLTSGYTFNPPIPATNAIAATAGQSPTAAAVAGGTSTIQGGGP